MTIPCAFSVAQFCGYHGALHMNVALSGRLAREEAAWFSTLERARFVCFGITRAAAAAAMEAEIGGLPTVVLCGKVEMRNMALSSSLASAERRHPTIVLEFGWNSWRHQDMAESLTKLRQILSLGFTGDSARLLQQHSNLTFESKNIANCLSLMFEAGADPNATFGWQSKTPWGSSGRIWAHTTAAFAATERRCTETLRALIDAGADVDTPASGVAARAARDRYHTGEKTALSAAVWKQDAQSAQMILAALVTARRRRCEAASSSSRSRAAVALAEAVRRPSAEIVRLLLEYDRDEFDQGLVNVACSTTGATPLHLCLPEHGAALLEAGADVTARTHANQSVLHSACASSRSAVSPSLVVELLRRGLSAKRKDDNGLTPLHYALQVRWGKEVTATIVTQLLENGADPRSRSKAGAQPLHSAVSHHDAATVEQLLSAGADVDAKDKQRNTALHYACKRSAAMPIVRALLQAGANVNTKDADGFHALNLVLKHALDKRSPELVDLLLASGADVTSRTKAGDTVLHYALHAEQMVKDGALFTRLHSAVLAVGASLVNAQGQHGRTVLVLALDATTRLTQASRTSHVKLLLENGAKPNIKDLRGRSPLSIIRYGELGDLLRKHGARL